MLHLFLKGGSIKQGMATATQNWTSSENFMFCSNVRSYYLQEPMHLLMAILNFWPGAARQLSNIMVVNI